VFPGLERHTPLLKLHLNAVDYSIVVAYFLVILLIGLLLRRSNNTSRQFFEAGRSLPLAITGIAFVAANCGSLEVMGMVSTSAMLMAKLPAAGLKATTTVTGRNH
jgi:Na+/proline symporter